MSIRFRSDAGQVVEVQTVGTHADTGDGFVAYVPLCADRLPSVLYLPLAEFRRRFPNEAGRRPLVVTLCGSTRFADAFIEATRRLTLEGKIVISVGLFGHAEGMDMGGPVKQMLDALHKEKIRRSDYIYVLNVGGYIGSSTRSEVEFAAGTGTPVDYLERPAAGSWEAAQAALSRFPDRPALVAERGGVWSLVVPPGDRPADFFGVPVVPDPSVTPLAP